MQNSKTVTSVPYTVKYPNKLLMSVQKSSSVRAPLVHTSISCKRCFFQAIKICGCAAYKYNSCGKTRSICTQITAQCDLIEKKSALRKNVPQILVKTPVKRSKTLGNQYKNRPYPWTLPVLTLFSSTPPVIRHIPLFNDLVPCPSITSVRLRVPPSITLYTSIIPISPLLHSTFPASLPQPETVLLCLSLIIMCLSGLWTSSACLPFPRTYQTC